MIPELKMPHYAQVVMVVNGSQQKLLNGELVELGLSSLDPAEYDPKNECIRFRAKFRIGESFFIGELAGGKMAVLQSSSGFHLYNLFIESPMDALEKAGTDAGNVPTDANPLNDDDDLEIGRRLRIAAPGPRPHQEHDYGS